MTASQKMEVLTKDFLERDGDTFVRIRKSGRLGWESTLPQDGAYSEYMLHPESQEDLIRNAYRMASDMITVMDSPFKVNISITPESSCTDAKTVWVATKVFDDADLPVGKKLDTFIGLAVHEGCHLLYTKFAESAACSNGIVKSLQNIIEDERIERECGEAKPGLANFLKASKYYYFDKYRMDMIRSGQMDGLDTFKRLMNTILSYVRYPKALDPDDLLEFADVMLKVREILLPYPASTAESTAAAEKIYEVMKDFMQQQDNGRISVTVKLQQGTRIEETLKTARQLETRFMELVPEIELISTTAGSNDDASIAALFNSTMNNKISMTVRLNKKWERDRTIWQIAEVMRQEMVKYAEITEYQAQPSSGMGGGGATTCDLEIFGYDFDKPSQLADQARRLIMELPGARDVNISREDDRPEIKITVDKEKASRLGLSSATISTYLRNRVFGVRYPHSS